MTSVGPQNPADPAELDEDVLNRLFDLAGPEQSIEILQRLIEDLSAVQTGLPAARKAEDLRRQLHVLVGIAGTVGASRLHAQAVAAVAIAREGRLKATDPQVLALLPQNASLIQRLQMWLTERSSPKA